MKTTFTIVIAILAGLGLRSRQGLNPGECPERRIQAMRSGRAPVFRKNQKGTVYEEEHRLFGFRRVTGFGPRYGRYSNPRYGPEQEN
jgi:hypothetical protein